MKITSIQARVCNAEMRNWVFVRVETDQPGLFGWGEATLEWKTRAVVGALEDLEALLIGQDPRDIEQCHQIMTRHGFWRLGVEGMSAISGIEIALWDILGKSLGVPVWRLLGGKVRDHLRTYTHLGLGDMKAVYESSSVEAIVERGRIVTQAGYDAVKVVCIPYTHYVAPAKAVDAVADMVGALREAVGPEVDIMVDFHGRPASVNAAMDYIRAIEPARIMFAEEPLPPEDVAGLAHITAALAGADRLGRATGRPPRIRAVDRGARLPHRPARHLPYRRVARGQEDRRPCRNRRYRACPAQSTRAAGRRRRAAFRHIDAQRHHPGGNVGRGRLVRRRRDMADQAQTRSLGRARIAGARRHRQ